MSSKIRQADKAVRRRKSFPVPTPDEIKAGMSGKEAWSAATLARWGVPWPPRKGWKEHLEGCRAWA